MDKMRYGSPPFDGRGRITGHNLFVSAYHWFAQMGDERVPEPMKCLPPEYLDHRSRSTCAASFLIR